MFFGYALFTSSDKFGTMILVPVAVIGVTDRQPSFVLDFEEQKCAQAGA